MLPFNKSFHNHFETLPATPIQLIHPTLLMQAISGLCDTFKSNDKTKDAYC